MANKKPAFSRIELNLPPMENSMFFENTPLYARETELKGGLTEAEANDLKEKLALVLQPSHSMLNKLSNMKGDKDDKRGYFAYLMMEGKIGDMRKPAVSPHYLSISND